MTGHGEQLGATRPDWGDGWADLTCSECKATWTGPIGEPCEYCAIALDKMRAWQGELALRPPGVDPDDTRRPAAVAAWTERLAVAAKAGLISEHQAIRVLKREQDAA